MKKILLFLLLFVNLQIVWQDGSLSFQLNSSTFAQSMGHEPGDEDSPSFDDDGIAWTTGYEGDDLIITPDDTPSDSDASTETTDSTDDSSSDEDEDGGGAGGYIGGINTIVVPEGDQKKDSCTVCHSIKGPNGECLCCPLCHIPKARCSCCKKCGKPKGQCDCYCSVCHKIKEECDCCKVCHKRIDKCDCCKLCHKLKNRCECICPNCNVLLRKCSCCKRCLNPKDSCACCSVCHRLKNVNCICCKNCQRLRENCTCSSYNINKDTFMVKKDSVFNRVDRANKYKAACNIGVQQMFYETFGFYHKDLAGDANTAGRQLKKYPCAWHKIPVSDVNTYVNDNYFVIFSSPAVPRNEFVEGDKNPKDHGHMNTVLPGHSGTKLDSIYVMDTGRGFSPDSTRCTRSREQPFTTWIGKEYRNHGAFYYYDPTGCLDEYKYGK